MAIGIGLGALVIGFLVYAVASQWSDLQKHHLRFDPAWIAPAFAVLMAVHVSAALGWDLVLRALGHRLRPARAQMVWGQSIIARYVPGTVLMLVGRVLLAEREGVPRRTTGASIVYEQGLQLAAAILIGIVTLIGSYRVGNEAERIAAFVLPPLLIIAMHPRIFGPLANRGLRALGREPLPVVMPMGRVIAMLAFYVAVWAAFGLGAFLVAQIVFHVGISDLSAVMAAQALSYAASVVALVFPAGIGVRDAAFAIVLAPALAGGFPVAAAIAIAVRLASTLTEIVYVSVMTVLGRRSPASASANQDLRAAT